MMQATEKNIAYVHKTIQEIWVDKIRLDYQKKFLLKEDTLKNAFYYHLRRNLGDRFLKKNNLAIFTEFYIAELKQRVDLVVVEVDPDKAENGHLVDAVKSIIAIVEMKFKSGGVADAVFEKDVEKVLHYSQLYKDDVTKFYVAFIREKYFNADEVTYFLDDNKLELASGKVVELLAYWVIEDDSVQWQVVEH